MKFKAILIFTFCLLSIFSSSFFAEEKERDSNETTELNSDMQEESSKSQNSLVLK